MLSSAKIPQVGIGDRDKDGLQIVQDLGLLTRDAREAGSRDGLRPVK
jgi:hypothetical protein